MTLYEQFIDSSLDTAGIGLDCSAGSDALICTPLHASIIGWANPGGLHFCFVDGLGEVVFAVDPLASDDCRIQPIAEDFHAFLGLIIRCRGTGLLSATGIHSQSSFEQAIETIVLSNKQRSILRAIENGFHPSNITQPWQYIQDLQENYDYASIPLHPEFDAHYASRPGPGTWDVTYGSSFTSAGTGKPGKEIPLGKIFSRGSEQWIFPAAYICSQGIVIDCFAAVDEEALKNHQVKWESISAPNWEQEMRKNQEDPLQLYIQPKLYVDGKPLRNYIINQNYWVPWQENTPSLSRTLRQYELDMQQPWIMMRLSAPKKGKKKSIQELRLTLESQFITVPGIQFKDPTPGTRYPFYHCGLGSNHVLTVQNCTCEELDPNFLWNLPGHHRMLTFTLEPEIDDVWLRIRDKEDSDVILPAPGETEPPPLPSAVFPAPSCNGIHTAISAMHYQTASSVTWQMLLRTKKQPDISWLLIP